MFESLLGGYGLRVLVAGIIVIGLIVLTAWLVRRFGGERLGGSAARGRQPRLAVIDAATVDGRRRLVLIRRDNVEHLLIIGGPTDVVVEQNIVRGAPAQPQARPPAAADTLPRAVPLGEGNMWPLQPEPAAPKLEPRAEPTARIEPTPRPEPRAEFRNEPAPPRLDPAPRAPRPAAPPMGDEQMQWPAEPEAPPLPPPLPPSPARERRPRSADPLTGLAEELSRPPAAEPGPIEPTPPRMPPRREPRMSRLQPGAPQPPVAVTPPPPAPGTDPAFNSAADQNLAEMAQRLEAALRRPAKDNPAPPMRAAGEPEADDMEEPTGAAPSRAPAPSDAIRPARSDARPPARPESKPVAQQKSLYDSLEQEMASLLGRPNGKS